MKKQRQLEFDHQNFSLKDYLNQLEKYKVKIELPDNYSE